MTDLMGPGKLVCHMQSLSHTYDILDMHGTGTKHIVCHSQKSGVQWSVICKFNCIYIHAYINTFIQTCILMYICVYLWVLIDITFF